MSGCVHVSQEINLKVSIDTHLADIRWLNFINELQTRSMQLRLYERDVHKTIDVSKVSVNPLW